MRQSGLLGIGAGTESGATAGMAVADPVIGGGRAPARERRSSSQANIPLRRSMTRGTGGVACLALVLAAGRYQSRAMKAMGVLDVAVPLR